MQAREKGQPRQRGFLAPPRPHAHAHARCKDTRRHSSLPTFAPTCDGLHAQAATVQARCPQHPVTQPTLKMKDGCSENRAGLTLGQGSRRQWATSLLPGICPEDRPTSWWTKGPTTAPCRESTGSGATTQHWGCSGCRQATQAVHTRTELQPAPSPEPHPRASLEAWIPPSCRGSTPQAHLTRPLPLFFTQSASKAGRCTFQPVKFNHQSRPPCSKPRCHHPLD